MISAICMQDAKDPDYPPFSDPWADWKPQWNKQDAKKTKTPHDFQEKHSPTEAVSLKLSQEREIVRTQRRLTDARLWDSMEPMQQQAATEIVIAHDTLGRGLGYVTSDWQRIPGARGPSSVAEAHSRLINAYIDWTKSCHKEGVSHSMVLDILAFGYTCQAIDRDRRVKTGSTRKNLMDGLTLYGVLKGWCPKTRKGKIKS